MKRLFSLKTSLALVLALLIAAASASAEAWRFGVIDDTQWIGTDDGQNPNSVAVGLIKQVNPQFMKAGVKFVVQVGDLVDKFSTTAMDTRAQAVQDLYYAGIGYFPLRGNHESTQAAAAYFQTVFPQTQGTGSHVFGASNFSSPGANLTGLSYSFDFDNARFVLLDQFTPTDAAANTIDSQQSWISGRLSGKSANTHAFVFGHKNLIGENHTDTLFGADPSADPAGQNAFIASLHGNGVRYYISGHDHIHQRSLIKSPDGTSSVQEIIGASDSSKFYIPLGNSELPGTTNNDVKYDNPTRETSIAQERYTVGYYIYTVDGPRVTVDFYSSPVPATNQGGEYLLSATPALTFTKRETFGYSINGKEFLVAQGEAYTKVQDTYSGTTAKILSGVNAGTATDGSNRPFTQAVNTGWSLRKYYTVTPILSLWGMATTLGSDQTEEYTLSMSYDKKLQSKDYSKGLFGLAARNADGEWVNAVDENTGGVTKFVKGPWKAGYGLGTYGVDTKTHTAWAVLNYNGDFAVARFAEDVAGMEAASAVEADEK